MVGEILQQVVSCVSVSLRFFFFLFFFLFFFCFFVVVFFFFFLFFLFFFFHSKRIVTLINFDSYTDTLFRLGTNSRYNPKLGIWY